MRVATSAAETEVEAPGGEDEVPAELLEVHLDLVNTAGLVFVSVLLLDLDRANIPGWPGVTFVTLVLVLVLDQLLLSSSSYELPWSGQEFVHDSLEEVLSPEHPDLLTGEVLREQEWGGEREEEYEVSHHQSD